jgi:hypothetical protein
LAVGWGWELGEVHLIPQGLSFLLSERGDWAPLRTVGGQQMITAVITFLESVNATHKNGFFFVSLIKVSPRNS